MAEKESWHLDKKVPIGIIFTIFVQSLAIVWWAGTTTEKLNNLFDITNKLTVEMASENLRQWARINNNESSLKDNLVEIRTNQVILQNLQKNIDEVKDILKGEDYGTTRRNNE